MKSLTIALTASFLVAFVPLALADEEEQTCNETAETSWIEHPLQDGTYIYIDPTTPNKLGEWFENNGEPGLQTELCWRLGVLEYVEDLHEALLP